MPFLKLIIVCILSMISFAIVNSDPKVYSFEAPNLKTVLFKETDLLPHCWSTYEVNLLVHRRVLQDVIPRTIPRDLPMLLKYLKIVMDTAVKYPPSINHTLLIHALGDVIGGYLQAIVLPIAREAYYAGNVDYETVAQLHEMYDQWRWYLSTDGSTWSQECDMRKIPTKVATLDIDFGDPETACKELFVTPPVTNETETFGSQTFISEQSRIAIPYFDNNMLPSAIALPFKKRNLYSLQDPKAAYILVKYYTLSMRCLAPRPNDILAFNNFFHLWLMSKLVPHLHDPDHFYPAFGAVMRVVETIKQKGLAPANSATNVFIQPIADEHQDSALGANLEMAEDTVKHGYIYIFNNPYALLIILLIFLILLFACCCCCLLCIWKCRPRSEKKLLFGFDSNDSVLKNTLFSLYCGLKDSVVPENGRAPDESSSFVDTGAFKESYLELPHLAPNAPYTTSDVSLSLTSDSDEEYSTTSKE